MNFPVLQKSLYPQSQDFSQYISIEPAPRHGTGLREPGPLTIKVLKGVSVHLGMEGVNDVLRRRGAARYLTNEFIHGKYFPPVHRTRSEKVYSLLTEYLNHALLVDHRPMEAVVQRREPEVPDLALPMRTAFAPSTELAKLWIDGTQYYLALNKDGAAQGALFAGASSLSTVKNEFSRQLYEIVVSEIRGRRGSRSAAFSIVSREKIFDDHIEYRIADSFAVRPKDLSQFLDLLASELLSYFKSGGIWQGNWGAVKMRDGSVRAELLPRARVEVNPTQSKTLRVKR